MGKKAIKVFREMRSALMGENSQQRLLLNLLAHTNPPSTHNKATHPKTHPGEMRAALIAVGQFARV